MKKWMKYLTAVSLFLTVLSPFNVWAKDSGELQLNKATEDAKDIGVKLYFSEGASDEITSIRFKLYVREEYGTLKQPEFDFAGSLPASSVKKLDFPPLEDGDGYAVDVIISGTEDLFKKQKTEAEPSLLDIGTLHVNGDDSLYASVGMIREKTADSSAAEASENVVLPSVEYVTSVGLSVMKSHITNDDMVYVGVDPETVSPPPTVEPDNPPVEPGPDVPDVPVYPDPVVPTATPIPTATPVPTVTPVPSATPAPSVTPVPTVTAAPTPTPEQQPTITPGPVVSSDGIEAEPVLGTRKVNLSWPEVSDADGYVVYMKNEETGKFKRIKTIYNTEQTSLSKLLDFGGTHTFKICTFTKVPGAPSVYENLGDEITVKLYGYNKYEQPAAKASTKTGSKQINLQWDKVEDADGYLIYKYNTSTKKYELLDKVAGDDTTSYSFTNGLENGVTYAFRVRSYALKEDGETQVNGKISATFKTTTPPAKAKKPAAVSKVKAQAQISWTKVANAKGYRVYRSTSRNGKYTSVGTITDAKTLQFTDSKKLKSGKTYFYKIRAYSLNPDGSKSFGAISAAKAVKVK